jgi:hypothetical protein
MSRALANIGFANEHESHDAIRIGTSCPTVEWLPANRWRMRGSWERSRLGEIDSPLTRTLPSQQLRRVFYFPEHGHSKFLRLKPERETRIPGLAHARSAGPAGGNEAQAGHRWQSGPGRVRYGGAPFRAPRQNLFLNFGSPHLAAQRTLVVKISDTSHHGKSGFESRL